MMQQLSLFRGVHDTQPRPVTLEELVTMMRTDQSVRDLTEKHRHARSTGDEQGASRYKKMMTSFGVAALFEGGRRQQHIVALTGLSLVDIDHIPAERMGEVLALVRGDEHTLLAYTTLSGQGVRVLFRYETPSNLPLYGEALQTSLQNNSCEHPEGAPHRGGADQRTEGVCWGGSLYKQAFLHGNAYYEALTGLPTDGQCKNVGRISTIAYDEELYYNPEATPFIIEPEEKKSVGRPRRVERVKMTVERCEDAVLRELEQRGVVYAPGTHNKYISDACYMMNRYGVSESDCTAWALDKFADYQAEGNDVASIVRSCYQQTEEHGTARPPKAVSDKQATVAQIEAFLAERVQLRRNVVTGFVEVRETETPSNLPLRATLVTPPSLCDTPSINRGGVRALQASLPNNSSKQPEGAPHRGGRREGASVATTRDLSLQRSLACEHQRAEGVCGSSFRQFTDDDRNSLWRALSKDLGVRVVRQDISAVVKSDFSPRYHPFEDYINRLQPWDGVTDHIGRLASSVTVKGDQEYFARCFKKWLVAFIAAIFDPEEVNHEILVFIGRQGSYKSTWFHYLLPPELRQYFLPKLMSSAGITKDDLFKIAQSGLVCLEEIDHMKQRDLNQLKAITTMRTINERRSYGEFNEYHRHIASFCATGNNRFFLTDPTGNRRFLTFEVESIVPPQTYDYGYEGVYAQAYTLWRQGFRYWFDEEENAEINRRNTEFEAPNKEWELINKYYRRPLAGEECKFLTATDILERINASVKERLSVIRVGNALLSMGYERTRAGNLRGYRVVEIPYADIERKQKDMGKFTDTPNEDTALKGEEDVQTELPF